PAEYPVLRQRMPAPASLAFYGWGPPATTSWWATCHQARRFIEFAYVEVLAGGRRWRSGYLVCYGSRTTGGRWRSGRAGCQRRLNLDPVRYRQLKTGPPPWFPGLLSRWWP